MVARSAALHAKKQNREPRILFSPKAKTPPYLLSIIFYLFSKKKEVSHENIPQ
jgi:hypothetical protein